MWAVATQHTNIFRDLRFPIVLILAITVFLGSDSNHLVVVFTFRYHNSNLADFVCSILTLHKNLLYCT